MMWALNDSSYTNTYEMNNFCVPEEYTLSSQWEFDSGYAANYSDSEIDLATVLMNLKDDYPANDGGGYYRGTYDNGGYQQSAADGGQQFEQSHQWQAAPSDGPSVAVSYDSPDSCGGYVRSTASDDHCLLPAVLGLDEDYCKVNSSIVKKRAGRPRSIKVKRSKTEPKLSRIWEFIRDLLLDAQYCPTYICWENYEEGRFRFVQSDKVAKLWGKFKRNERMNYEKFSRAMRYYYKTGVLLPVQGKRLVYKFGPKATGWQTNNPNFKYTY